MIRTEWMINTTSGPATGEAVSSTAEEAWGAIQGAFKGAMSATWGDQHEEALARLKQAYEREGIPSLEGGNRWAYRASAVWLTLYPEE